MKIYKHLTKTILNNLEIFLLVNHQYYVTFKVNYYEEQPTFYIYMNIKMQDKSNVHLYEYNFKYLNI